MSRLRREPLTTGRLLRRAARALTTPLLPRDYLASVNPMWSREWRGRVVEVSPETPDIATVTMRPNRGWPAHRPGQYLRLGIELDGRRHWRAYTVTSDPGEECVSVTVKATADGVVSGHLVRRAQPGDLVHLGAVEGTFGLPAELPAVGLLVLSAGSGITPIIALLRELDRRGWPADVDHLACVRAARDLAFAAQLDDLRRRRPGYRLRVHFSAERGRIGVDDVIAGCPDWRERATLASGPGPLLDALQARWAAEGIGERLAVERFQPIVGAGVKPGAGGSVHFRLAGVRATCDGITPMLAAGLQAGARLPHGCEMGICRTCVGTLVDGRVRDLRTGEICAEPGTMVRTCVSCPEGAAEIDL